MFYSLYAFIFYIFTISISYIYNFFKKIKDFLQKSGKIFI